MTDNSTEEYFNFLFHCDICHHNWDSIPIEFSAGNDENNKVDKNSSIWKSEHEAAYERANREAMMYFNRCPVCKRWVCDNCFMIHEKYDICKECSEQGKYEKFNQKERKMMNENSEANIPIFLKEDIEKNKTVAGLAYILFFLPLLACPDSPFGKFHANQGFLLLLFSIAGNVILSIIPFLGWVVLPFFTIAILIIAIISLISAMNGNSKELPVIGKIRIFK